MRLAGITLLAGILDDSIIMIRRIGLTVVAIGAVAIAIAEWLSQ